VGLRWWIGGGWGVDALVGHQTRVHRDLDLALDVTDATPELALSALSAVGYRVETDWLPSRVELAASSARWVDLHPLTFDDEGTGWQANVDGLPPFRYPPAAFSTGFIAGCAVSCLSVAQQLLFHSGYPPRRQDLADVALLRTLANRQHDRPAAAT
jgi:lincosamide nucleotidyltransferase A/C/D/E